MVPLVIKQSVGPCELIPHAQMRKVVDLTSDIPELDDGDATVIRGAAKWCQIGSAVWVQILKACLEDINNDSTRHTVRVIDLTPDAGDLMLAFMSVKSQFVCPMTYGATTMSGAQKYFLISEVVSFLASKIIDGSYAAPGVHKPAVEMPADQIGASDQLMVPNLQACKLISVWPSLRIDRRFGLRINVCIGLRIDTWIGLWIDKWFCLRIDNMLFFLQLNLCISVFGSTCASVFGSTSCASVCR